MFLIIEGPDRCGKSTIAEKFAERTGWEIIHSGKPEHHPLKEYVLSLENVDEPKILDRWHLGEFVYPSLKFGRDPLPPHQWLWIEMFLASRGAILVHMTDDPDRILGRVLEDDDSYLRPHEVHKCARLFHFAVEQSILDKVTISLDRADQAVKSLSLAQDVRMDPPHMIGRPDTGGFLLVGDRLGNPNPADAPHKVPFAPYNQSSGRWLLGTLRTFLDQLEWRRLKIVNSWHDGPVDLESIVERYKPKRVVALGKQAHEALTIQEIPHATVHHPQYMRRFHHSQQEHYANAILTQEVE